MLLGTGYLPIDTSTVDRVLLTAPVLCAGVFDASCCSVESRAWPRRWTASNGREGVLRDWVRPPSAAHLGLATVIAVSSPRDTGG